MDQQDPPDLLALQDLQALKDHKDSKVWQDYPVNKGHQDSRVALVLWVLEVVLVCLEPQDHKVLQGSQDQTVSQEVMVTEEHLVLRDSQVLQDPQDQQGQLVYRVRQDS